MMQTSLPGVYAVGDGAGIGGVLLAEVEGEIAGLAAAGRIQGQAERAEPGHPQAGQGVGAGAALPNHVCRTLHAGAGSL